MYTVIYSYCGGRENEKAFEDKESAASFLDYDLIDGFLGDLMPGKDSCDQYCDAIVKDGGDEVVFKGTLWCERHASWWGIESNQLGDFFANTEKSREDYERIHAKEIKMDKLYENE